MRQTRLSQLALTALVIAIACLASLPSGAAFAAGATGLPVIVRPSDANGNELPGPGYYQITATPGSTTQLYALVGNKAHQPAVISVIPVDAATGVYGGVTAKLASQPCREVGTWIHLSQRRVKLGPDKGTVVPFTLTVPKYTRPGQYLGALTAFVPSNKTRRGKDFDLTVQTRLADDVVVTVPGPQRWRFTIAGVSSKRRTSGTYLIARIKNSGSMMLKGSGYLWVWQPGRRKPILAKPLHIETTLPHTMVRYPLRLGLHPRPGRYSYKLSVRWTAGRTKHRGTIRIR